MMIKENLDSLYTLSVYLIKPSEQYNMEDEIKPIISDFAQLTKIFLRKVIPQNMSDENKGLHASISKDAIQLAEIVRATLNLTEVKVEPNRMKTCMVS